MKSQTVNRAAPVDISAVSPRQEKRKSGEQPEEQKNINDSLCIETPVFTTTPCKENPAPLQERYTSLTLKAKGTNNLEEEVNEEIELKALQEQEKAKHQQLAIQARVKQIQSLEEIDQLEIQIQEAESELQELKPAQESSNAEISEPMTKLPSRN